MPMWKSDFAARGIIGYSTRKQHMNKYIAHGDVLKCNTASNKHLNMLNRNV